MIVDEALTALQVFTCKALSIEKTIQYIFYSNTEMLKRGFKIMQ